MLAHVSPALAHHNETLQVIQLAARIHRMKRRRTKFSSTSSEDSSTDESGRFRRPYRGLRMGTLREDMLYSSPHSDPDYTSSSEQSCDTVIYRGVNGQSLSDRELNDHEGPPRHVPRTNPRLPRRPSGSRSSGEDSDSGRSRTSDGRPRPAMGMRVGVSVAGGSPANVVRAPPVPHVISMPASPSPSHLKMSQLHSKGTASKGGVSHETSGHWPDKVTKHRGKVLDTAAEQWIDGPGAAIYPESKKAGEQWVDGPSAFVVQNEQQQQQQTPNPHSPSHRGDTARRMKSRKVDAEEQWVDGPREMMAASAGGSGSAGNSTPLHTSSKTEPLGRAVVGQPNQAPKLSTAVNDKALKQALMKHLEKELPDTAVSVDSPMSSSTEAAHFRPNSGGGSGEGCRQKDPWDRRQAGDGISVVDVESLDNSHKSHTDMPSASLHRKQIKDHVSRRLYSSITSSMHSPKASPACSRKSEAEEASPPRLQKCDLPGSASPTQRVVQWIKSVTRADTRVSEGGCVQATCHIPAHTDVTMADAETNTEHDSDFERLADSDCLLLVQEQGQEVCNNGADNDLDSSMDTSRCSATRRESLYEVTVEEKLESLVSPTDSGLLAKDVDDETFSSVSAREADDIGCEESALLQNSKHVIEKVDTAKVAYHLTSTKTFSDFDHTALLPELPKPLSRKPDGASNPHLNQEFSDDNCAIPNEQCASAKYTSFSPSVDFYTTAQVAYTLDRTLPDSVSGEGSKQSVLYKPPLAQKPAYVSPKPAQLTSTSSLCSSSGPSAGSSATSTPKSLSSKESPAAVKHTSKTSMLCSGRKDKGGKAGKDKTSTSSSSLGPLPHSVHSKSKTGRSVAKLSFFSPKTSGPVSASPCKDSAQPRKKDKESDKTSRQVNGHKYTENSPYHHVHNRSRGAHCDCDNSNDIVVATTAEKRLLSPYATVTPPKNKVTTHSSSGHGSDNSSTISTEVHCAASSKVDKVQGGTSSGYESMLRESEETASSDDHDDTASEHSQLRKGSKKKGTKRSRSAPARSSESPCSTGGGSQGSRVWVDTRHGHRTKDEPLELKKYDMDDVERLQRRRQDDSDGRGSDRGREAFREVYSRQPGVEEGSKAPVSESKDHITMDQDQGWTFDCKFLMCFCKSRRDKATDV